MEAGVSGVTLERRLFMSGIVRFYPAEEKRGPDGSASKDKGSSAMVSEKIAGVLKALASRA